jgi:hypothetical protein
VISNWQADTDFKLGLAPNALVTLRNIGLAAPDQVTFRPASVYYVRADLTRVGDGFSSATWVWDMMSTERMSKLLSFLSGADYVRLYIKTDVRDGTHALPRNAFKVFSAIMWKPIVSGEEGVPVAKSPYVLQTVQVKFVDLLEQVGYL